MTEPWLWPWVAFPTWWIAWLIVCSPWCPATHPWRARPTFFTLAEWHAGQTPLCRQFDVGFWIATELLVIATLRLLVFG